MEVKAGYKQTDVGIIPNDWVVKSVKELNVDLSDGNYSSKYPKASDFRSMGVPFIRANNVHNMTVVDDDLRYISATQHAELLSGHLKKNDILITTRGEIGQIAFVPDRHIGSNINAQLVRINLDKTGNDGRFVGYILSFDETKKRFEGLQTGSALKQLPVGKFITLVIPLPPTKAEQEAIAETLSDADALIEALEQLLAKKRQVKQGAMQELLTGKKRLVESGKWEMKKIGEITHTTSGGTPSTLVASYWGGDIRWMSSGELHLKKVYDVEGRITEEGLRNSSTKIIPPNCVLIGLAGQGKTRGTVAINMVELCTNQSIAAIFPSSSFVPDYLYFNLDNRYEELREVSSGDGGRGGLNLTLINKLEIPLPSIPEQIAIAEILSDMDAEISALEGKLVKARQVKAGMMSVLLTGRVRLV